MQCLYISRKGILFHQDVSIFFLFLHKNVCCEHSFEATYVVGTHLKDLSEVFQIYTHIYICGKIRKKKTLSEFHYYLALWTKSIIIRNKDKKTFQAKLTNNRTPEKSFVPVIQNIGTFIAAPQNTCCGYILQLSHNSMFNNTFFFSWSNNKNSLDKVLLFQQKVWLFFLYSFNKLLSCGVYEYLKEISKYIYLHTQLI